MLAALIMLVIAFCLSTVLVPTVRDIKTGFTAKPGERAAGEGHDVQSNAPAPLPPAQSASSTPTHVVGDGNLPVHAGVSRQHTASM